MTESVSFEKIAGKNIFTIFSSTNSNTKHLVIMCHGFKGNSVGASRTFVNFTKILNCNDISVLRFDQPNSGNSEGEFIDSKFSEWVATIKYFVSKYHTDGYSIALLGHSMGATASMIAASELGDFVRALLLWAPDPKSDADEWLLHDSKTAPNAAGVIEEAGQQYHLSFWREVKHADFFEHLRMYNGLIHLVYGEHDKFVSPQLRNQVITEVKKKKQTTIILPNQDHLGWEFEVCKSLYSAELELLQKAFTD